MSDPVPEESYRRAPDGDSRDDTTPALTTATGRVGAPLLAAALAALVYCAASALRGVFPFGETSRNTNDLGQQFIPMYAHFRDILAGDADGGVIFSWQSGFGTPFLGDALAYVGTSFSWLTLLLPRDRIDTTLFLVYLAAVGSAAALMTALLRRLRPAGPTWLAVIGGTVYGVGAWPLETGYMTTWLNGVVAFPALCLLADWVAARASARSVLVAPPLVALLWTTHFYTVYMATIGAAVFLVARTLTRTDADLGQRLLGLVRAGAAFGVGIALAAPALVPVQQLISTATPSAPASFSPAPWGTFLTRLLPATAGVAATPAIGVGVLFLALAAAALLNRRMPLAERVVWPATLALVVLSMQLPLTHLVWHAFDTPNGNPYRQSFVTAGFIVITGWMCASVGVRLLAALGGAVPVVALLLATGHTPARTPATAWTTVAALAVVGAGWVLWSRTGQGGRGQADNRGRRVATVAVVLVMGATVGEAVASAVAIDARRSKVLAATPPWNALHQQARELVAGVDDWPAHRTDPGTTTTVNDPMLLGGQGSEYYSSTIQTLTSRTLTALGWGYSSYGRALVDPANPVTDAIFSVRHRVVRGIPPLVPVPTAQQAVDLTLVTRASVAPLVTVRDAAAPATTPVTVWDRHEVLLRADLYDVPARDLTAPPTARVEPRAGGDVLVFPSVPGTGELVLTARCTPGSEVFLHAPALVGDYLLDGTWTPALRTNATRPGVYTGLPIRPVGTADETGAVRVRVRMTAAVARVPLAPLACLRPGSLADAVAALTPTAATDVRTGSRSITFTVPATSTASGAGAAVISVPRLSGWSCSGAVARPLPDATAGLITVPLSGDAGDVTCSYRPPGTRIGLAIGAAAVIGWLVLALALRARHRRGPWARSPRATH